MPNRPRVLILDDEAIVCERLKDCLEKDFEVETFVSSQAAIDRLGKSPLFEVVVTDLKMTGPSGLDVMHFVRQTSPRSQVIIITGYGSMDAYREAEYSQVFEFVQKPFELKRMASLVKKAARKAGRLQQGG